MRAKILTVVAVLSSTMWTAIPAFAGTVFTDQTFNLANYSASAAYASASTGTVTDAQCTTCGDPGFGLQFTSATSATAAGTVSLSLGLVNMGFSYNPHTQGAITTFSTSVDKNIIVNVSGTG